MSDVAESGDITQHSPTLVRPSIHSDASIVSALGLGDGFFLPPMCRPVQLPPTTHRNVICYLVRRIVFLVFFSYIC